MDISNVGLLQKNLYALDIINRIVKRYVDNSHTKQNIQGPADDQVRYFKLPYLGTFSKNVQIKINKLVKRYCIGLNIRVVFQSFKISSMFSTKDQLSLKSHVVYLFKCGGCGSTYIGETFRHLNTRIHEHLHRDANSHIFRHLQGSAQCKTLCDDACFTVLDSADNSYSLRLKEAMYITWMKPDLNGQIKTASLDLFI